MVPSSKVMGGTVVWEENRRESYFVEATRPLFNIHWGQCVVPGKGTPILMQTTGLSPTCPLPSAFPPRCGWWGIGSSSCCQLPLHCSHSHVAQSAQSVEHQIAWSPLPAFIWNSERVKLSVKNWSFVVYATQGNSCKVCIWLNFAIWGCFMSAYPHTLVCFFFWWKCGQQRGVKWCLIAVFMCLYSSGFLMMAHSDHPGNTYSSHIFF